MNKLPLKPFCKWPGGKRSLVSILEKYIPSTDFSSSTYYEPFVGAGALLFHLQPENAFISDTNYELINTYKVIRDNVDELITMLQIHKERHDKEYFMFIRELDRVKGCLDEKGNVYRASRFIYLNKTCFNGLYRVNQAGQFNVSFGRYKNPLICDESNLKNISYYLNKANVSIKHRSYTQTLNYVLEHFRKGDFVYLDPPYYPLSNTANFTAYTRDSFQEKDQLTLCTIVSMLSKKGIAVLQSNSNTEFIRDIYSSYSIDYVDVKRNINCDATKRSEIKEVLISNEYCANRDRSYKELCGV